MLCSSTTTFLHRSLFVFDLFFIQAEELTKFYNLLGLCQRITKDFHEYF